MGLVLLAWPGIGVAVEPARPTRELLKLLPADASVVLSVDDLRGQTRALLSSPLIEDFLKLPAVEAWFRSEKYKELERARDKIEAVLKVSLAEVRDKVLGDAVVFALRLPAEEPFDPAKARGILLLKAAKPRLLAGIIEVLNSIQTQNGEIAEVMERVAGDTHYFVRTYPAGIGRRPDEYVLFPDGTFAISNAGGLISDVIRRKTGWDPAALSRQDSLAELPRFLSLDRRLPDRTVARLFVDARRIGKLLATAPPPEKEEERRNLAIVQRLLVAIESAGAALVLADGRLALHAVEALDPGEFTRIFGWPENAIPAASIPDRVPAGTLALVSIDLDFAHAYQSLVRWVPEADRPRLASFETAISGILLGQDLRTRVLPSFGPGVLAVVEPPRDEDLKAGSGGGRHGKWPFPTVVSVEMMSGVRDRAASSAEPDGPDRVPIARAVDNALRTFLAVLCLDEKRAGGRGRIVESEVSGLAVRTLEPPIPLAYAVDAGGHRLVLGTSADAVGRYLVCGSDPSATTRFRDLRAIAFPEARCFICLDLRSAEAEAQKHRQRLIRMIAARDHRPADDVSRDLDRAIDLARLFDAFFFTNRVEPQSSTVSQTLGLLGRRPGAKPSPTSRP
jgi:hypothetical protein